MPKNKKGIDTPGSDVAALILLIGLFILAYILLLPPSTRDDLLQSNNGKPIPQDGSTLEGLTILNAKPGDVHAFERNVAVRDLAPATLFTRVQTETINLGTRIEVKKTFFSETSKTFSFTLEEPQDISTAKLFFFIEEGDGTLLVELNGQTIFEQAAGANDIPVALPTHLLQQSNTLTISVRGRFWESYHLRDLNLKIEQQFDNTQVTRTFDLSSKERNALEKATLSYFLNCMSLQHQGQLSIELNGRILRSDYVVCDVKEQTLSLPLQNLRTGTNTLTLSIDQGDYQLEDFVLILRTGDAIYPSYNFEVDDDVYDTLFNTCFISCQDDCYRHCDNDNDCFDLCIDDCDIGCRRGDAVLEMRFGDDNIKKGAITINEYQINFNTNKVLYSRSITDALRRGDNVIKIIPKSDFEITDLTITVID